MKKNHFFTHLALLCALLMGAFTTTVVHAQSKIKDNSVTGTPMLPAANAILELESVQRGLLPPRMTTAQRNSIATPGNGMVIYNTDENCLDVYAGSSWVSTCGILQVTSETITQITNPSPGQIVYNTSTQTLEYYDGTNWVPVGGAPKVNNTTINNITNPSNGQLVYNTDNQAYQYYDSVMETWQSIAVPAMDSSSRNAIANPIAGQTIFNTDEDCLNTYNGTRWISLCGTTPAAQATITNCSAVAAKGIYVAGTALGPSNYLSIPSLVTSNGGSYNIIATTDNGYFFNATGTFPTAGSYVINLLGAGTPTTANATGDPVTITINGIQQDCQPNVVVLPATPDYTITSVVVNPTTPYVPGQPLTNYEYLTVTLNVMVPGQWSLTTATVDGYSFSGEGDIASASGYNPNGTFPQTVTVQVPATGTPIATGSTDNFTLVTTNTVKSSSAPFTVRTASLAWEPTCNGSQVNATVNGTFFTGTPLTGSETIVLPINTMVAGTTTITATGAGMTFTSGVITLNPGTTSITLTPANNTAPIVGGDQSLTLAGDGIAGNCTTIPITIGTPPAVMTLTSTGYLNSNNTASTTGGRYVVAHTFNENDANPDIPQNIQLNVNVTTAGHYDFTSTTLNGVTYSASGTFTNTGANKVILTPSGTPDSVGTNNYTITGNGITANVPISFAYRTFNIVSFVSGGGYGFYNNPVATTILNGSGTFGMGGLIPCQSAPKVINSTTEIASTSVTNTALATTLVNALNTNKADILYIGYGILDTYPINPYLMAVIEDFVFNKHGILMFANEYAANVNGYTNALVNALFNTTGTAANATVATAYSGVFTSNASTIINGPFGNLAGLMQTTTAGNSGFLKSSVTVPNSIVLSTLAPGNAAAYAGNNLSLQHTALGVYISLDNTFNTATMPANSVNATTGVPILPIAANSTTNSNNSALFANLFAWAVKYGAYNINTAYQVSTTPASVAYPSSFVPKTSK